MKKAIVILLIGLSLQGYAQKIVFDRRHLTAVSQNAAVRSAAENTHGSYLNSINGNLDNLNTNLASVVLAQNMIFAGLSNVNSALKNGLAVKQMTVTVAEISRYVGQAVSMARGDPYLVLFTNRISTEMRIRALRLVNEVSAVLLKEGNNILADYNSRDILLRNVNHQLQVMSALAYSAWKAMYWAKQRGFIASVNPFSDFIIQDRQLAGQIITNAKYLNP